MGFEATTLLGIRARIEQCCFWPLTLSSFPFLAVVVVTVDEMAVMVAEGESVNVTVRVEEGALARDVIIDLSLSSGGTCTLNPQPSRVALYSETKVVAKCLS